MVYHPRSSSLFSWNLWNSWQDFKAGTFTRWKQLVLKYGYIAMGIICHLSGKVYFPGFEPTSLLLQVLQANHLTTVTLYCMDGLCLAKNIAFPPKQNLIHLPYRLKGLNKKRSWLYGYQGKQKRFNLFALLILFIQGNIQMAQPWIPGFDWSIN